MEIEKKERAETLKEGKTEKGLKERETITFITIVYTSLLGIAK